MTDAYDRYIESMRSEGLLDEPDTSPVPIHCLSCGAPVTHDHEDGCAWFYGHSDKQTPDLLPDE